MPAPKMLLLLESGHRVLYLLIVAEQSTGESPPMRTRESVKELMTVVNFSKNARELG
jgi:hypothetical protein